MAKKSLLQARQEQEQEQELENELPTEQTSRQVPNISKGRGPVEGYITVEEALLRIPVCEKTLKDYLRQGRIKAQKFGGKWRIRPEAIENFLNGEG